MAIPLVAVLGFLGWMFLAPSGPPPAADIRVVNGQTGDPVGGELVLEYGETLPLAATVVDAEGGRLSRDVDWRSEDPAVATVSEAGVVTAASGGGTNLIASVDSLLETITLTVTVPVASVEVSDVRGSPVDQIALETGETIRLVAAAVGADGRELPQQPVSWRSRDPSTVRVDADGNLLAAGPGATFVDATSNGITNSVAVSVTAEEEPAPPPEPIEVEIVITRAPWANLFIDGTPIGTEEAGTAANVYRVRMMPGTHRILLEHPAFRRFQDTIDPAGLPIAPEIGLPRLRVDMIPRE